MKRLAATFVLALLVLGCGESQDPEGEQVQLLTGSPTNTVNSCYASGFFGSVVVDPEYGTAVIDESPERPRVIGWPSGFTGWRSGSEVRVLDRAGQVVVVTGRRYEVLRVSDDTADWPELPDEAFWACGVAIPPDIDSPASS